MGGKQPEAPKQPEKTVKEMVKEFSKTINKLRREFQREINKLEFANKKINNDITRMVQKKEPKSSMRIIAQNIIRNQNYITKYQRLDAQLSDVLFQLNAAATTETLVSVMKGMNDIMKKSNSTLDVKNIQAVLETFNMEVEKQGMMQEQIQEIMEGDQDDITDDDADKIINEIEMKVGGGSGGGGAKEVIGGNEIKNPDTDFKSLEERINALK